MPRPAVTVVRCDAQRMRLHFIDEDVVCEYRIASVTPFECTVHYRLEDSHGPAALFFNGPSTCVLTFAQSPTLIEATFIDLTTPQPLMNMREGVKLSLRQTSRLEYVS